jgi:hypothetical protein
VRARCGDGVLDPGEGCDQGPANGGTAKGACRQDCSIVGCGDGVLDSGEACDNGRANSDSVPNACRTTCLAPACGDHVVDSEEACDGDVSCTAHCTRDAIVSWHAIEGTPAAPPARAANDGCSVTRAQASTLPPLALVVCALVLGARRPPRRRRSHVGAKPPVIR